MGSLCGGGSSANLMGLAMAIAAPCCIAMPRSRARPLPTPASTRKPLNTDPVEGFAFFEESMELSCRFRALKLWLSVRYHGLGRFREAIRNDLRHAQRSATSATFTRVSR
jgi:glutamate/tyrosine decarboxylase-like PLP-dependent enzyme